MWKIAFHLIHFIITECPKEVTIAIIIAVVLFFFGLPILKLLFMPITWLINFQLEDLESSEQEDCDDSPKQYSMLVKLIAIPVYGYLWVKQLIERHTAKPNPKREKSSNYNKSYKY